METIKLTSKKALHYIGAYNKSTAHSLREVYKTCSSKKVKAEQDCLNRCWKEHGEDFRIVSHSCDFFTVGWTLPNGDLRIRTVGGDKVIPGGANYWVGWVIQYRYTSDSDWDDVVDYDDDAAGWKEARQDLKEYQASGTEGEYRLVRALRGWED